MSIDASRDLHPTDDGARAQAGLCTRCQQLQLGPDRFSVPPSQAKPNKASRARSSSTSTRRLQPPFQFKSGGSHTNFTTIADLHATGSQCRFCALLLSAIQRYDSAAEANATCSLTWEVDGRQLRAGKSSTDVTNLTRRLRFRWKSGTAKSEEEVYIIFIAPGDLSRPETPGWQRTRQSFGRDDKPIERQTLMRDWLNACGTQHTQECSLVHPKIRDDFLRLIGKTHFGVVDVNDMQLKPLPVVNGVPEDFVALSYVWGPRGESGFAAYATSRGNIIDRIRSRGLDSSWDQFPATIQDSILLVSKLGYRYLWIDALCIVKDSLSSWLLNAEAMHLVYNNASFTICAADGDASTGLKAANPIVRPPSESLGANSLERRSEDLGKEFHDDTQPLSAEILPGVRLLVTRPLEAVVNDSIWSTRAW